MIPHGTSSDSNHLCFTHRMLASWSRWVARRHPVTSLTPTPSHCSSVVSHGTSSAFSHACVPNKAHADDLVEVGSAVTSRHSRTLSHAHSLPWQWCEVSLHQQRRQPPMPFVSRGMLAIWSRWATRRHLVTPISSPTPTPSTGSGVVAHGTSQSRMRSSSGACGRSGRGG